MRYKVYERGFLCSGKTAVSDAVLIDEADTVEEALQSAADFSDDQISAVVYDSVEHSLVNAGN